MTERVYFNTKIIINKIKKDRTKSDPCGNKL
jgi:hypothetical protein